MSPKTLTMLDGQYAVCRLPPDDEIPAWAQTSTFWSVTRSYDELSVVCLESAVPEGIKCEGGWSCFKVEGTIPFTEFGVIAGLTRPLAEAALGVFVVSTFDTDYVLVDAHSADRAIAAWRSAGNTVNA